jgi:hypothetical protein
MLEDYKETPTFDAGGSDKTLSDKPVGQLTNNSKE